MPRNRKCFINGTVIETGCRTQEALPLAATCYMTYLLYGIFARASSLYRGVILSHGTVMSNHMHLILVVNNPADVPAFMGYIKRESAHVINRLLGRRNHKVWCHGYDSPVILDADKVIDRIVYLYTNPQRAALVSTIDEYPNISTWSFFLQGGGEITHRRTPRDIIPSLPERQMSLKEQEILTAQLIEEGLEENSLFIDPDAWIKCFPEFERADPELVRNEIIKRVREIEEQLERERREQKKQPLGVHALRLQSMRTRYHSKKHSKRMICLSSEKSTRVTYLRWFKELSSLAREAIYHWKRTKLPLTLPPGCFAPSGVLYANLYRAFVPLG